LGGLFEGIFSARGAKWPESALARRDSLRQYMGASFAASQGALWGAHKRHPAPFTKSARSRLWRAQNARNRESTPCARILLGVDDRAGTGPGREEGWGAANSDWRSCRGLARWELYVVEERRPRRLSGRRPLNAGVSLRVGHCALLLMHLRSLCRAHQCRVFPGGAFSKEVPFRRAPKSPLEDRCKRPNGTFEKDALEMASCRRQFVQAAL